MKRIPINMPPLDDEKATFTAPIQGHHYGPGNGITVNASSAEPPPVFIVNTPLNEQIATSTAPIRGNNADIVRPETGDQ